MKPKLGQWYKVTYRLKRYKSLDHKYWAYSEEKCEYLKIKNSEKAMLIGVRTLSDGNIYDNYVGRIYRPTKYYKAYMFVSDIREQPFFALPKHCEFMSNWQSM